MADEKIEIVIPKIKSPEEYENPTELYEKLIAMIKKYHPSDEISLIEKAYKLADDAHKESLPAEGADRRKIRDQLFNRFNRLFGIGQAKEILDLANKDGYCNT